MKKRIVGVVIAAVLGLMTVPGTALASGPQQDCIEILAWRHC
jgi:hypothetical protein